MTIGIGEIIHIQGNARNVLLFGKMLVIARHVEIHAEDNGKGSDQDNGILKLMGNDFLKAYMVDHV